MSVFQFKQFSITQTDSTMKVGTDAMLLGALIQADDKTAGLDVGSGTGILSLMIAQRNEGILIDAIEIDRPAALESTENFERSVWSNRLHQIHGSFLEMDATKSYDLIFSNPPYYQASLLNKDDRKARARHEEFLPLKKLVEKAAALLAKSGNFWIIVPTETADNWIRSCAAVGLNLRHTIHVIGKEGSAEKRQILQFSRIVEQTTSAEITIRDAMNNYTVEYIELTKEYHATDLSIPAVKK
jgi:tRNA1Val (adenine37-N6)-methyltransferase